MQDFERLLSHALEQPVDRSAGRDRFARSLAASLEREFRAGVLCMRDIDCDYSSMHLLVIAVDEEARPIRSWPSKQYVHPPESTHWGISIRISARGPLFYIQPMRYKRQKKSPWKATNRNVEAIHGLIQQVEQFLERQHALAGVPIGTLQRLVPDRQTALDDRWATVHDILFSEI